MIAPTRYLQWARRHFGQVPFDLASSGIARPTDDELGQPPTLSDAGAVPRLRAAIATFNGVAVAETIATLGTTHALWLAYAALLEPGDDVLVEEPGYEPLWRIAEAHGARVVRFERPVNERFALDPGRVERALTPRTRVVAVTNLHNPGGVRVDDRILRDVAHLCAGRGAHLLVDEVYAPFDALNAPGGVWHGSARKLAPNIVATSSLTKCYGLGDDRIGWLLGPTDVIARAGDALISGCGHLPVSHANIGAHAFARIDALAERTRRLNAGKRERVAAWVASRAELTWSAPESGLFGFATTTRAGDLTPVLEAGARDHCVLAAPGAFFGVPNGFRLSWSIAGDKLEEGLARLGKVLPGT